MTDSARGARFRVNMKGEESRKRRVSRPMLYVVVSAVAITLMMVSPRALTALHVGINGMAGLACLTVAVLARKSTERIRGVPIWLGCFVLGACFLALAVLEARDRL